MKQGIHKRQRRYKEDIRIEYPSRGTTYATEEYGVYKYDRYPRHSVLAGQTRRLFLDSFLTLEEAQKAYPDAEVMDHGTTGYIPISQIVAHLPDDTN